MIDKLSGFLFEKIGVGKYQKFLDITSLRHKLTAGNVANVTTPGYKSRSIDFDAELKRVNNESNRLAGMTTDPGHIRLGSHPDGPPDIRSQRVPRGDTNSVDIDREITTMAENELQFTIAARLLQKKFSGLKEAINSE